MNLSNIEKLDQIMESVLRAGRIPGAAVAIVAQGEMIFAKGYGYRDLAAKLSMTAQTMYPIASTTKAINATLLGMLIDEGKLSWDAPVRQYLPTFSLGDSYVSGQVTLRDLVTLRTGLPRHDWMWIENPISRAALVERMRHLELSAGFREKFQYNNLTVTASGYIAEVVTGRSWEELVRDRILEPLGMQHTAFAQTAGGNVTQSYHESDRRELKLTRRWATDVAAPTGGSIHSTVEDMAQWMLFNLDGGKAQGRQLIRSDTLAEIHAPQVAARTDPSCPTPHATYALGWFVDTYNGRTRVSHGGYLHDVNSEVTLLPEQHGGLVSFTNFGPPRLARLINEQVLDGLNGFEPTQSVEEKLAEYEHKIMERRERDAKVPRIANTRPSHALSAYAGSYEHPGYGRMEIRVEGEELILQRNDLILTLQHWHYDAWITSENDMFAIHMPHAFDQTSRLLFVADTDGAVASVSVQLEPAVAPIRFIKQR